MIPMSVRRIAVAAACFAVAACAGPDGAKPHLSAGAPAPGFTGSYAGASGAFGTADARGVPF